MPPRVDVQQDAVEGASEGGGRGGDVASQVHGLEAFGDALDAVPAAEDEEHEEGDEESLDEEDAVVGLEEGPPGGGEPVVVVSPRRPRGEALVGGRHLADRGPYAPRTVPRLALPVRGAMGSSRDRASAG